MSDEKLIVTKSKLDALATSISNKSGVATPLTIAQMKAAVDNLVCGTVYQDGDGYLVIGDYADTTPRWSLEEIANRAEIGVFEGDNITAVTSEGLQGVAGITRISLPNCLTLASNCFYKCTGVTSVYLPKLIQLGNLCFGQCTSLTTISLPNLWNGINWDMNTNTCFRYCSNLATVDLGQYCNKLGNGQFFDGCTSLTTLIMRKADAVVKLAGTNTFNNTPFASGGTGGTIYIPKVLYDCLGDGTSLDYKSATNWVTFDSYGTITWAPIEGSIYETQYADGTPISS